MQLGQGWHKQHVGLWAELCCLEEIQCGFAHEFDVDLHKDRLRFIYLYSCTVPWLMHWFIPHSDASRAQGQHRPAQRGHRDARPPGAATTAAVNRQRRGQTLSLGRQSVLMTSDLRTALFLSEE